MDDRFELPAELTIYSALETRDALLGWVTKQNAKAVNFLKISAKQVEALDGSGLQLLAALGNMNVTWHLVETSPTFTEGCQTMGFSQWLENPYLHVAMLEGAV